MSYVTAGNTGTGNRKYTLQEVEVENDEGEEETVLVDCEYTLEASGAGYEVTCPKGSLSNEIKLFIYRRKPTTEWYWDYLYGDDNACVYPVVFSIVNGKPYETLNSEVSGITLSDKPDGWICACVKLKRKLQKNERIFFGFFSELMSVVWNDSGTAAADAVCCEYSAGYRNWTGNKNNISEYIRNGNFISSLNRYPAEGNYSIYLSYENEIESFSYSVTVLGCAGFVSTFKRKAVLKRSSTCKAGSRDGIGKWCKYGRKFSDKSSAADFVKRFYKAVFVQKDRKDFIEAAARKLMVRRSVSNKSLPASCVMWCRKLVRVFAAVESVKESCLWSMAVRVKETAVVKVSSIAGRFNRIVHKVKNSLCAGENMFFFRNIRIVLKSMGRIKTALSNGRKIIKKLLETDFIKTRMINKGKFIRFFLDVNKCEEVNSRTVRWKKGIENKVCVSSANERFVRLCLDIASEFTTADVTVNNRILKRLIKVSEKMSSSAGRFLFMNRSFSDFEKLSDEALRKILIRRSGIELIVLGERLGKTFNFVRSVEAVKKLVCLAVRKSELYRSGEEEVPVFINVVATRIFYRFCETVMSVWDWLRGKICETNNVVTFFCPVSVEVEFETDI